MVHKTQTVQEINLSILMQVFEIPKCVGFEIQKS